MTAAATQAPVAAGDLLANGRYRVEEVLGEGGMGLVCAAKHVALGQKVAIKFLLPEALEHPQAAQRFEREARASASLTSEHVVRVTDVGTLETGAPYFVMEFLEGEDLAQRLRREGPLDVRTALSLMAQACEGLIEAHAKGLVHRDIKPSNLFLAKRASGKSVLKVIDFGIAKAELTQDVGGHELTRTSEIMGSPQYMSPEQLRDTKNVDARTDIWSLGAAFYECLAGRPPFTGETMTELIVRIATEAPPLLLEVRPDIPPELCALLERCLTKPLLDRFESAAQLLEAIEAIRGSATFRAALFPRRARVNGAGDSGPFIDFDETAGPISATRSALPRGVALDVAPKRQGRGVAIVAVALLCVVALGMAFRPGRDATTVAPSAQATASAPPSAALPVDVGTAAVQGAPAAQLAEPEAAPKPADKTTEPADGAAPSAREKPAAKVVKSAPTAPSARPVAMPPEGASKSDKKARSYDPGFE